MSVALLSHPDKFSLQVCLPPRKSFITCWRVSHMLKCDWMLKFFFGLYCNSSNRYSSFLKNRKELILLYSTVHSINQIDFILFLLNIYLILIFSSYYNRRTTASHTTFTANSKLFQFCLIDRLFIKIIILVLTDLIEAMNLIEDVSLSTIQFAVNNSEDVSITIEIKDANEDMSWSVVDKVEYISQNHGIEEVNEDMSFLLWTGQKT